MTAAAIGQLDWVLGKISDLAALGQDRYDADELMRWSIERLWIFAGNLAERHRLEGDIPAGVFPWSDLVAARNVYAHYVPDQISYDRLWHDVRPPGPSRRGIRGSEAAARLTVYEGAIGVEGQKWPFRKRRRAGTCHVWTSGRRPIPGPGPTTRTGARCRPSGRS